MIDLALNNLSLLCCAVVIGVVTGRWAFSSRKAVTPATETPKEDEAQS
jgi:hypothetical protein